MPDKSLKPEGDPESYREAWVFITLATTQKAVLSYRSGILLFPSNARVLMLCRRANQVA